MNDLLEGMIAYAREHNCSDIHLNVGGPAMILANGVLREYPVVLLTEKNVPAYRFYKKNGFREKEENVFFVKALR